MPKFKAVVKDKNGVTYTLSDNTHVGATPPTDPDKTIWFDNFNNQIKVLVNKRWTTIGPGGCITVGSPTSMPIGYSVIIVTGSDVAAGESAVLSFVTTPPAGSVIDIIIWPKKEDSFQNPIQGWDLIVPTNNWNAYTIFGGGGIPGDTMIGGLQSDSTQTIPVKDSGNELIAKGIHITGALYDTAGAATTPIYIRAISDGDHIYYITTAGIK